MRVSRRLRGFVRERAMGVCAGADHGAIDLAGHARFWIAGGAGGIDADRDDARQKRAAAAERSGRRREISDAIEQVAESKALAAAATAEQADCQWRTRPPEREEIGSRLEHRTDAESVLAGREIGRVYRRQFFRGYGRGRLSGAGNCGDGWLGGESRRNSLGTVVGIAFGLSVAQKEIWQTGPRYQSLFRRGGNRFGEKNTLKELTLREFLLSDDSVRSKGALAAGYRPHIRATATQQAIRL
jgi:hypothetical protein